MVSTHGGLQATTKVNLKKINNINPLKIYNKFLERKIISLRLFSFLFLTKVVHKPFVFHQIVLVA